MQLLFNSNSVKTVFREAQFDVQKAYFELLSSLQKNRDQVIQQIFKKFAEDLIEHNKDCKRLHRLDQEQLHILRRIFEVV